jgi:hypothetical protein
MTGLGRINDIRDRLDDLQEIIEEVLELADAMDEEDPLKGRGMGEFADELRAILGDEP